jgi:hypothetical protein
MYTISKRELTKIHFRSVKVALSGNRPKACPRWYPTKSQSVQSSPLNAFDANTCLVMSSTSSGDAGTNNELSSSNLSSTTHESFGGGRGAGFARTVAVTRSPGSPPFEGGKACGPVVAALQSALTRRMDSSPNSMHSKLEEIDLGGNQKAEITNTGNVAIYKFRSRRGNAKIIAIS